MSVSHLELCAATAGAQRHTESDGKRTGGAQTQMHGTDGEEGKRVGSEKNDVYSSTLY